MFKLTCTGVPNIGSIDKFHHYIDDMMRRKYLTNNGVILNELEERIKEYLGVKHCIVVSSGTVALQLVAAAFRLNNKSVLIPSFTFIATPHAFRWIGALPIFCDIQEYGYHIDVLLAERMLNEYPDIEAIVGVNTFGELCDIIALENLAAKYNKKLIFDSAHAFGCAFGDVMVGNFGSCEIFSFHATKVFNTFEGGAITTNDRVLADTLRSMRNFGIDHDGEYDYSLGIGINAKMSEVHAAFGLINLDSIDSFIAKNIDNYKIYSDNLRGIDGVKLMRFNDNHKRNYHYIVIDVDDRDVLMRKLMDKNIMTRRYFYPACHKHSPYMCGHCPNSDTCASRTLCLPTGVSVDESIISKICDIVMIHANDRKFWSW